MMPPIAEQVQGRKDRDSSVSTDNKGEKLGRPHRIETLQQSFVRESKSMKSGSFRNAVREEEKVSWQTPPVIKETIIEASLDDEDPGKYKVTTRVKKVKKVKKAPKKEEEERKRRQREEAERLARERSEERQRLEAQRLELERLEALKLEAERLEAARLEAERLEAERLAQMTPKFEGNERSI